MTNPVEKAFADLEKYKSSLAAEVKRLETERKNLLSNQEVEVAQLVVSHDKFKENLSAEKKELDESAAPLRDKIGELRREQHSLETSISRERDSFAAHLRQEKGKLQEELTSARGEVAKEREVAVKLAAFRQEMIAKLQAVLNGE